MKLSTDIKLFYNSITLVILLYFSTVASPESRRDWPYCGCGFGGLCIKDPEGFVARVPCKEICPQISKGFYGEDCDKIVDHCSSSPCVRGTCISTFGSYFCQCPKGVFGQKCDVNEERLIGVGPKPELYVYYQVQPRRHSSNMFTVVYDPSGNEKSRVNKWQIQMVVNISDGRSYHPRVSENHFDHVDVRSKCLEDAKKSPDLKDIRACSSLPSGNVSSFTFEPAYYGPSFDTSAAGVVTIDGLGMVGRASNVSIYVYVLDMENRTRTMTLFSQTYQTFTYHYYRAPHNCRTDISFTHCSSDHRFPYVYGRGEKIKLDVIQRYVDCEGVLSVGFEWYLQRHTDSIETKKKNCMPVPLSTGGTKEELEFPSRFFSSGIHMIEYALTLRGYPPNYGGTKQFRTYGRCWIRTVTADPVVVVKGGGVQSVSCHRPMILDLMNINPDVDINDILFEVSCNDTDDTECDPRFLDAPVAKKLRTKCNTYLQMKVAMRIQDRILDPIFINIHFIDYTASMRVECMFNCYPINTDLRTVLVATTERYMPSQVNWTVTMEGKTIPERDGDIRAFHPSTATRILRMNSARFSDGNRTRTRSNVHFEAQGVLDMRAMVSTISDNLETNVNDFKLHKTDRPGTYKFVRETKRPYSSPPVMYRIWQYYNKLTTDVMVIETNYEDRLIGSPLWDRMQICVYNAYNHLSCKDWEKVDVVTSRNLTVEDLKMGLETGDYYNFFKEVFTFFMNGIQWNSVDGILRASWNISIPERLEVLNLVNKARRFRGQSDLNYALQLVVMNLYSTLGNELENLVPFTDDDYLKDLKATTSWLQLKHATLSAMYKVIEARYATAKRFPNKPYGPFEFGDLRSLIITGLSLHYIQKSSTIKLNQNNTYVARKIQAGIWAFWLWKNENIFRLSYTSINRLLAFSTRLFYGIESYGRKFTRCWAVRTTYVGIRDAFVRGRPEAESEDNFPNCAGHIFGRGFNSTTEDEDEEWLDLFEVELPPPSNEWEHLELVLVVTALKNKKGDGTVSPLLNLEMRSKHGDIIHYLPDSKPLNVTLPRMKNGVLVNRSLPEIFRDSIPNPRSTTDRPIAAYKITLPVEFNSWDVVVRLKMWIPIKVKVFDKVPDPEMLTAVNDSNPYPYDGIYYTSVKFSPSDGSNFIPQYFYLGISPSFKVHDPDLEIFLIQSADVCTLTSRTTPPGPPSICRGLNKNYYGRKISCNCKHLGAYSATALPISITKLLSDSINLSFVVPHRFTYNNAIVVGILASLVVLLSVFAYHKDRISRSQDTLVYLNDNYPTDDYIIVVGVYTGLCFQGGTSSKVGIKLIGERHTSRVHVLSTPGRQTLANGQDDWFVITLSRSLGKLTSVHLWQDHHDLSGWFCKFVIVYDIIENKQYKANVDKWLVVNVIGDTPRIEIARALAFDVTNDGVVNQTPHSFIANYTTEMRNTHHEFSFFLMHERYLYTYEVKCFILLTKVLSICMWIWFFQEVAYNWTHGKYLDPVATRRMVGLSKELFIWAFWAALLSHPLTFLLDCLYRFSHLSKIVQKRTTNPLHMVPGSRSVSPVSRRLSSRVRASAGTLMRKHSRASRVKYQRNIAGEWKTYLHLAFGPCQFRCADIDRYTITTIRMHTVTRIVRLLSLIILAALFSSIVYIEFYTEFRWKSGTSAVVVALAIFLDAFLLSPFLILVKSSITFFVFEMDNKETFLLSEEMRVHRPMRVHYLDYLYRATGKEYKPLLTPEIEGLRRKKLMRVFTKKALFHSVALVAMCICITLLTDKYSKEHFYMMRTLRDSLLEVGDSGYDEIPWRPITQVFDISSAAGYVSSTIAGFTGVWPNGEQMKGSLRAPNFRWSYDHFGQGIGSTSVLLLLLGNEEHHVVPLEFEEYFDDVRGSYSESTAKTDPIILGNKVMNYTVISNSWIYGKTKTAYPFAGHLRLIPLNPWEEYYSQMRILMDDLMMQEDNSCRALIVSTNYIYPFAMYLVTIDVIIEFHSSGTGVPMIQVRGIKTGAPSHANMTVLRWMMDGILLFFTIYTFAGICRVGLKGYLRDPFNIIKCFIVLTTGAAVFGHVLLIPLKYGAIQQIVRTSYGEYGDLHSIYIYELADSFCLLFVFLVLLIDVMLIIPRLISSEWFTRFCLSSIRSALLVYLLQQYTIFIIREVAQMFDNSYGHLIMIHTHQIPPNVFHSGRADQATMFNFSVVVLTIMSHGLTAIIICIALATKGRTDIPLSRYVAILKTKPQRLETTTPPMRRMTEMQSSSRRNTSTGRWSRRHTSIASAFKRKTSMASSHREQRNTLQRSSALTQLSDEIGKKQKLFS